jgi:hypothetical protein
MKHCGKNPNDNSNSVSHVSSPNVNDVGDKRNKRTQPDIV